MTGLDLSEFIPDSLIDMLDPDNSLNRKWDLVTKDAKCASRWSDMDANGCIP